MTVLFGGAVAIFCFSVGAWLFWRLPSEAESAAHVVAYIASVLMLFVMGAIFAGGALGQ